MILTLIHMIMNANFSLHPLHYWKKEKIKKIQPPPLSGNSKKTQLTSWSKIQATVWLLVTQ